LFSSFDRNLKLYLTDQCGRYLDSVSGTGALTKDFTPATSGWYQFRVRNAVDTNSGQRVWIQALYTAPDSADALATRSRLLPFADLGADRYGCTGSSISLNPGFSDAGLSFVWKDASGNQIGTGNSQPVNQAGLYSVTITNTQTGCTAMDTIRIISFENPPPPPLVQVSGDTMKIMNADPGFSYSWRRNGVTNPADTLSYFIITPGTLSLNLTTRNSFGCTNVTANLLTSVAGLLTEDDLRLYPNPASGSLFVRIPENRQLSFYEIIDFTGRVLLSGNCRPGTQEIKLKDLSAGLYLFRSGPAVKKFRVD